MPPLISAGLQLMLVGMGTVFFFLTLLVFATRLMSSLAAQLSPADIPEPPPAHEPTAEEVVAISAAIAAHKRRQR